MKPTRLEVGGIPVAAVMTRDFFWARPDLSVEALMRAFTRAATCGGPVVDADGRLMGFVSMNEVLASAAHATVEQIMIRDVIALPEHASVSRAASIMAFEGIHQIPVVARDGSIMGVVRARDILR